jgi:hypothetical protein
MPAKISIDIKNFFYDNIWQETFFNDLLEIILERR